MRFNATIVFKIVILSAYCLPFYRAVSQQKQPLNKWQYIMIDSARGKWGDFDQPEWLRYFGLDMMDINRDGYKDIIAGRYFYLNPGSKMETTWKKTDLGMNADGCMLTDIDEDEFADVIAMAYPNVLWYEADNQQGSSWTSRKIGEVPKTDHVNGQGFRHLKLFKNSKETILLSAEGGLYAANIPYEPTLMSNWKFKRIATSNSDEGIGYGDIDKDGDVDIVLGDAPKKGNIPNLVNWFENPGNLDSAWEKYAVGTTINAVDRIELADLDGDGKTDITISEEMYPGLEPLANLYTFRNLANSKTGTWERKIIFTGFSVNNLDVADIDKDGDIDIVTAEHKGKEFGIHIFENNGNAFFTKQMIDKGKESHLGTQLTDLDNDGDLDIVSIAWDQHKFLHIWRNDAINKTKKHLQLK
jgi:hypothetical protein